MRSRTSDDLRALVLLHRPILFRGIGRKAAVLCLLTSFPGGPRPSTSQLIADLLLRLSGGAYPRSVALSRRGHDLYYLMLRNGLIVSDFHTGNVRLVNLDQVRYIAAQFSQSEGRDVGSRIFFLPGHHPQSILVSETVGELANTLPSCQFLADGQEYIFNLRFVLFAEDEVSPSGHRMPGSRIYFQPGKVDDFGNLMEAAESFWLPLSFEELLDKLEELGPSDAGD